MQETTNHKEFLKENIIILNETYSPYFRSHAYILKLPTYTYLIEPNFTPNLWDKYSTSTLPHAFFATHCHYDHICQLNVWEEKMKEKNEKFEFWAHENSLLYCNDAEANCSKMFGTNFNFSPPKNLFDDEAIILLDKNFAFRIFNFRGHSKDLCWLVLYRTTENFDNYTFPSLLNDTYEKILANAEIQVIFGGDFIFDGGIGRFDLKYSEPREMIKSLKRVLDLSEKEKWSKNIPLLPGHGEMTTWGNELSNNPYLNKSY